jgi:hypothetical protein
MKRRILMVMVVAASMAAMAQPQAPLQKQPQTGAAPVVPMSATVQKQTVEKKVEIFTPLSKKIPPPKQTDKIVRVDGMSSQPWFRTIGPKPGWSAFPPPEQQDATLNLFWVGAAPSH